MLLLLLSGGGGDSSSGGGSDNFAMVAAFDERGEAMFHSQTSSVCAGEED